MKDEKHIKDSVSRAREKFLSEDNTKTLWECVEELAGKMYLDGYAKGKIFKTKSRFVRPVTLTSNRGSSTRRKPVRGCKNGNCKRI